jgi:hypothetical protein
MLLLLVVVEVVRDQMRQVLMVVAVVQVDFKLEQELL